MKVLRRAFPILVVLAAACSDAGSGNNSPSTTAPLLVPGGFSDEVTPTGLSAELAAVREANDGRLPLAESLDLFALTFGEVPGGDGALFSDGPTHGTMAWAAVVAHWDELSLEQQNAVRSRLGYPSQSSLIAPRSSGSEAAALQARVDALIPTLEARLGVSLSLTTRVEVKPRLEVVWVDGLGTTHTVVAAGVTVPEQGDGVMATSGRPLGCKLQFLEGQPTDDTTLAHEVFHCFQFQIVGDVADFAVVQPWIVEGSAEWAGGDVGGVNGGIVESFTNWALSNGSLFAMDYEAIGYYYTLETLGVSPWSVIGDMLHAAGGVAAVASSGLDPTAVLRRVATVMSRRAIAPTIPVSAVWDFASADVPSGGQRSPRTVTAERPFELEVARADFRRVGPLLATIEGGSRVAVSIDADVGALEFYGKDPIDFVGGLHQEFCLDPEGCTCGADDEVDSGLQVGARELIAATGELDAGTVRYKISVPDDMAFTDGHWSGTITSTLLSLDSGATSVVGRESTAPFEFTIENGAVTSGTYGVSYYVEIVAAGGTARGTATVTGTYVGCGFSPQLVPTTYTLDASIETADGFELPLQTSRPMDEGAVPTVWVMDSVADPDHRSGHLDVSAGLSIIRSTGFGASNVEWTFEVTRTD